MRALMKEKRIRQSTNIWAVAVEVRCNIVSLSTKYWSSTLISSIKVIGVKISRNNSTTCQIIYK
jgi:hypothetical protein